MSVTGVLFDILVVLAAAKLAGEVAQRIGIPPVVGEIVAGILVGRSVLGIVGDDEVLKVFAELGVILLLVEVGMEMDPAELKRVGRPSLRVAFAGVALPFISGYGVAVAFGVEHQPAVFLGAALTATSVGITARVFGDLKALSTVEARTVLGAAIADDVIGLVILTVVVGSITSSLSVGGVVVVAVMAIVVLAASLIIGGYVVPWLIEQAQRLSRSSGTLVGLSLALILVFSLAAAAAGLAPIVGAFVAGLTLARSTEADRIKSELAPVGHLFVPVFFLQIGIDLDVTRFVTAGSLGLSAALLGAAVATKFVAAWAVGRVEADKSIIGIGMLPRGEVGLIFAGLGLREGILGQDLYGALLLVVFATTLITPPLLRWRLAARAPVVPSVVSPGLRSQHPLVLSDGMVELGAPMPPGRALDVTLEAALALADGHQPGPRLLDHIGSLTAPSLRWDEASIEGFFRLLRYGNARSWRFLETSTVLDRVLPELGEVLRKRRADRHELDPSRAFRWSFLERLHETVRVDHRAAAEFHRLARPDLLLLATLVLDAAPDRREAIKLGRKLCDRLALGASAQQEVAVICGSAELMRAALRRPDALHESSAVPIAAHAGRPDVARALYLTALAEGHLQEWQRSRLDELHRIVQTLLDSEDQDVSLNVIERRREAAIAACEDRRLVRWIEAASPPHLVATKPDALIRHAGLMERAHALRRFQVEVVQVERARWRIEVAAPDRRGLLARTTEILSSAGSSVTSAMAVITSDIALQSFLVTGNRPPEAEDLQVAFTSSLDRPLRSPPLEDVDIRFDDSASPWYTVCEVRTSDRAGLLHAVATALTVSGVNVRSAQVSTQDGKVVDRFELVGKDGAKLEALVRAAIVSTIQRGVEPRRQHLPRFARTVMRGA